MLRGPIVPLVAFAALVFVGWLAWRQGRSSEEAAQRDAAYLHDFWEEPADGAPEIEPVSHKPNPRVRAFYQAINEAGARVYLVAKPKKDTRTIHVRMRIPEDAIETVGNSQVADLDLGGLPIRVVQPLTPTATTSDTTPDGRRVVKVPYAPGRDLSSVFLVKTYTQKRQMEQAERPVLDAVSSWEVKDEFPELISVQKFEVLVDNCDTAAIEEVGDEVVDTSVAFHPIDGCSKKKCEEIFVAWLRAHHDVQIILKMLDHIEARDTDEERAVYWREPWADQAGNQLADTSFEYYFGEFDLERFKVIRDAYERLRTVMTDPGQLEFECTEGTSLDCTNGTNVAAFHKRLFVGGPAGHVGFCPPFFSHPDDEPFVVERKPIERVRLSVHEALHFTKVLWVNGQGRWIDDEHEHKHGENCDQVTLNVDDRNWCNVLHLAVYPGSFPDSEEHCVDQLSQGCSCGGSSVGDDDCAHHDTATINNDTYGFATAEIGAGLRREGAHHWPSVQYSSSSNDDCLGEVTNPLPTIDTCFYSAGSLDCADATIAVSSIGDMQVDCPD